jgi:ribosomal protein S3AE
MNLVLDIGGSSTKYKIFDQKQKCLYSDNVQYGQLINAMAIQKIVEGIYLTTKEKYPISNIAISSLGIIDSATGQISGLGGIANYNSIN